MEQEIIFTFISILKRGNNKILLNRANKIDKKINLSRFSFHKCNITVNYDLTSVIGNVKTTLERPWRALSTLYYGVY